MRIEIPEAKKPVYEMRFPVRWGDMDAMGHVNNTVYFRYLETARIEWMRSVGCNPAPDGQGQFAGVVLQLRGEGAERAVLFDFNHPLAGQPVTFEVQLIGVL